VCVWNFPINEVSAALARLAQHVGGAGGGRWEARARSQENLFNNTRVTSQSSSYIFSSYFLEKILGEMQISGGKPEKSRLQALRCWNDDQSFNNKWLGIEIRVKEKKNNK
jgi:hypothetical protein